MMPRLNVAERMPPPENDTPNGLSRCASLMTSLLATRSGGRSTGCAASFASSASACRRLRRCSCSVLRTVSNGTLIGSHLYGCTMVGDSSASNVQIVRTAQRRRRNRAGAGALRWWSFVLLLELTGHALYAQSTVDSTRPCRHSADVAWRSLAPPGDHDVLDRWCDSVGPP